MPDIKAIADLHGNLPEIPDCDLLLIGGDICPDAPGGQHRYELDLNGSHFQLQWLADSFAPWLKALSDRGIRVIGIAGNHDFVFEKMPASVEELYLPWTYLKDSGTVFEGIKIWGTPWVPGLTRWAFYGSETALEARMDLVPLNTDILLSHGPPFGTADEVKPMFGGGHVGDRALADWLDTEFAPRTERKMPVVVCGHIHEQYGIHRTPAGVLVYCVPYVDEIYDPRQGLPVTLQEFR